MGSTNCLLHRKTFRIQATHMQKNSYFIIDHNRATVAFYAMGKATAVGLIHLYAKEVFAYNTVN